MVRFYFVLLHIVYLYFAGCPGLEWNPHDVVSMPARTETVDSCVTRHTLRMNSAIPRQVIDQDDEPNQLLSGEWGQGKKMTDGDHSWFIG